MSGNETTEADETDTTDAKPAEVDTTEESSTEATATLDVEAATGQETTVEDLQQQIKNQEERINELEGLLTDLSVRVADGRDMGVCPDCGGPVTKVSRWFRSDTIECADCGRVFYTY